MPSHSKLSPSASERWINCPISVHLSEGFKDTQSIYAAEGSLAHKLGELKIYKELKFPGEEFPKTKEELVKVRKNKLYQDEMEEYTDEYLEHVRSVFNEIELSYLLTEIKVDLSEWLGANSFGTADCIICSPGILHIFDFKYGKNVEVKARNNSQMRLYALGAAEMFDPVYGFETVITHIIQPRMNNFSSETIKLKDLRDWANSVVKPAAEAALTAKGDAHKGKWCTFCLAKAVCREYGKEYENPPGRDDPHKLSLQEIAYRISKLEGIDTYLKILKEFALSEVLSGKDVPGYKAVEGRSNRSWSDQEKAFNKAIESGIERSALYEEKPLTLAKIEKLMGKKEFNNLLGEFVIKPQGKPTLVKDTDKRSPFKRKSAKESFKNVDFSQIEFSSK